MLGQAKKVSYTKLKTAMENDILSRFPAISRHIQAINIDKNHISGDIRSAGIGIACDSKVCAKEALPLGVNPQKAIRYGEISDATKKYIDTQMDSVIIYHLDSVKYTKKEQIGIVQSTSNVI